MATETLALPEDMQQETPAKKTVIVLNEQQESAIDAMIKFVREKTGSMFTLKGFAGTGKTTAIQFLLDRLNDGTDTVANLSSNDFRLADIIKKSNKVDVCFTAPTHKAVKVLRRMARDKGLDVPCSTIHSLLGLTVKYMGEKQILEKQHRRRNDPLMEFDVVVVDECSMIGEELFDHIRKALKFYPVQFIFMGDPAQLPPVGEKESPTFESTDHRATLTKVMRQRGENPVLGVCTDLREAWQRGDTRLPQIVAGGPEDGSMGVNILTGLMWMEWMPQAFSHENFDDDPDRFRVIAWRNETVNKLNSHIHQLRYPDCEEWLAKGEPVVFVKPCIHSALLEPITGLKDDEIIVQTDFEGKVLSCLCSVHPKFPNIPCHIVTVVLETGAAHTVWALDNEGIAAREYAMRIIANQNKALERQGGKGDWWPYYELQRAFAELRPAYCMTAHKSQGSTFENVFVDVLDIWGNPNKSEALQCLYVACSRASHHLIVNATGAA